MRLLFLTIYSTVLFLSSSSSISASDARNHYQATTSFGRAMRQKFQLDPGYVNLNHGSFGTYPISVRDSLHAIQARVEANPDLWMHRDSKIELSKIREQLAQFMNTAADDIVMVPNTTGGLNAILRSLIFKAGDRILYCSTIFESILNILKYVHDTSNETVTLLQFNITYPISNDEIVSRLELFLNENNNSDQPIRLALIDHISSAPGVIMPIERIIPVLKKRNILVVIDGAHAIGQIPINVTQLAPDFYVTSCNKWLFAPKGSAVLFVDKKHQDKIHPVSIGSNYAQPAKFQQEFFATGTIDYSPYMSVTAALEFRRSIGGENAIYEYNHNLAMKGGNYLAAKFGTQVLQEENQMGSIVDVLLPIHNHEEEKLTTRFWIHTLFNRFPHVYARAYKHGGKWWIRVSAQIYNDLSDFDVAANTFLAICKEINANLTSVEF